MSNYDGKIEPLPTQKKTLTEQWRNGTLEENMYYVKLPEEIIIANIYQLKQLDLVNDADEIEVLAPVPSYDELKKLDNELKELATKNDTLAMENGRLQKELEIATKALKDYADRDNYHDFDDDYDEPIWNIGSPIMHAELALKEMEGVK